MGYSTEFVGSFTIQPSVDEATYQLLLGLATTRRMKRRVSKKYGVDGEFYVVDDEKNIANRNQPPRTQPSLWCQWLIQPDHKTIRWDGKDKFSEYIPWLLYLQKILKERDYLVKGRVVWLGEAGDAGILHLTPTFLMVRYMDPKTMDVRSKKIRLCIQK